MSFLKIIYIFIIASLLTISSLIANNEVYTDCDTVYSGNADDILKCEQANNERSKRYYRSAAQTRQTKGSEGEDSEEKGKYKDQLKKICKQIKKIEISGKSVSSSKEGTSNFKTCVGHADKKWTDLTNLATNGNHTFNNKDHFTNYWRSTVDYWKDKFCDDDNDASTTLTAGTMAAQGNIYTIDCTSISAVKFYVNGAKVGTGSMAGLTAAIGNVQPYFCISKAKSSANTGTGTMLIDYVKIWQDRA